MYLLLLLGVCVFFIVYLIFYISKYSIISFFLNFYYNFIIIKIFIANNCIVRTLRRKELIYRLNASNLCSCLLLSLYMHTQRIKIAKDRRHQIIRLMKDLPNYSLRARSDRLEVLVALQDGELGVPDLDRVKHGG